MPLYNIMLRSRMLTSFHVGRSSGGFVLQQFSKCFPDPQPHLSRGRSGVDDGFFFSKSHSFSVLPNSSFVNHIPVASDLILLDARRWREPSPHLSR